MTGRQGALPLRRLRRRIDNLLPMYPKRHQLVVGRVIARSSVRARDARGLVRSRTALHGLLEQTDGLLYG